MTPLPAALRNTLIAVAGLIIFVVASFALVRGVRSGEVLPGVTIAGTEISLGGLSADEAEAEAAAYEAVLATTPISVRVNGSDTTLIPQQIGIDVDEKAVAEEAMTVGREGGVPEQFRWWLGHLFSGVQVEPIVELDPDALESILVSWDAQYVGTPAFLGAVEVEGNTPVAVYPHSGQQIDRASAGTRILETVLTSSDDPAVLDIGTQEPSLTRTDIDRAVEQARLWVSGPITLVAPGEEAIVTFQVPDLAAALVSSVDDGGITLSFDPAAIQPVLDVNRPTIELPPVDARLEIGDTEVTIIPGRNGTLIDAESTARELAVAAASVTRRGVLPFVEGAEPKVTTEDLETLGIRHLVASFTTYHDCCQNRVSNIHLIADAVDGVMLAPGEELDLNEHVGQRTTDKGYQEDGTIEGGELVKTVGGGVSQFATTLYNAVFWGGYEDITHKPHSFYFSRYPEGIEATISWPQPDLIFRNDSDHGVLVKTEYTNTSITVKIYGDNDGRVVIGAHRNGTTEIDVVEEGGPQSRHVSASVSDRYGFTDPSTEYRENAELAVDQQRRLQSPRQGWSVTVTRVITLAGVEDRQEWVVRYLAQREILEVHPCMMPDEDPASCPTTTTTTVPDESTTTTTEAPSEG